MAVVVQCYNCSTILELDDGFRGGVCRCSNCGSLLQVPKAASTETHRARPAAPGAAPTQVGPKRPDSPLGSSGLKAAAESATGSGAFARSPVRPAAPAQTSTAPATTASPVASRAAPARAHAAQTPPGASLKAIKKTNTILWISLAGVVAIVVVVVILLGPKVLDMTRRSGGGGTVGNTPGRIVSSNASCLTVPLVGRHVVFSVDAGSSAGESFDYVRVALAKAIDSLTPEQQFQVAVWKESKLEVMPDEGKWSGKDGLDRVKAQLDATVPAGATDAAERMKASVALGADQVVFITAKQGLGSDVADAVLAARKPEQRLDAIRLADSPAEAKSPSPLEAIATKAGGTYVSLDATRLEELTKK